MTACRNKASRAVTAALVGVLSVGAVPMVAIAAPTAGDGASLLATTDQTIAEATVEYEGETSYVADGDPHGLVATTLTPNTPNAGAEKLEYTWAGQQTKSGYYYFYVNLTSSTGAQMPTDQTVTYKNVSGKDVAVTGEIVERPKTAGTYAVVSGYYDLAANKWTFVKEAATFTITSRSLEGATLVEGGNVDDTEFMWDGTKDSRTVAKMKVDVALDGVILKKDRDYSTVDFYVKATSTKVTEVEPGVEYKAIINGIGKYAGQTAEVAFTISPLNLDEATISGSVAGASLSASATFTDLVDSVNGVSTGSSNSTIGNKFVTIEFVKTPSGSEVFNGTEYGEYTYRVVPVDQDPSTAGVQNDFVTGSKEFTVVRAASVVTFTNANTDGDADGVYEYDLTKDDRFDLKKITASSGVEWDDIDFTVTSEDGKEATEADLTKGGTWYVTASVYYYDGGNNLIAGKKTYKVVNSYDQVKYDNVYVSLDGKNVEEGKTAKVTYDGSDWADKVAVMVAKNDVTLVEGTDYTVTIQDEDGKAVDSIVDAGDYKVVVKGVTFSRSFDFDIEVKPVEIGLAFPKYDVVTNSTLDSSYAGYFGYTGEAIDAAYRFFDADGNEVEVPASAFEVDYQLESDPSKDVELKEVGKYTAQFSDATVNDNWDLSGAHFAITRIVVSDAKVFADVPNDAYYAQSVYTANSLGYIYGMAGTDLFAPNNSISRADMAVMLFRMAGGELEQNDGKFDVDTSYLSKFSDVNENAYYAKAVAWATQVGVVAGYADGTFGPADPVTTEQFAVMLANYAKVAGEYEAADTDEVLAGVSDGSAVSAFAREQVAWAVENGYIAQGGAAISPQAEITRGRAVTIAVRYQPTQANIVAPNTGDSQDHESK